MFRIKPNHPPHPTPADRLGRRRHGHENDSSARSSCKATPRLRGDARRSPQKPSPSPRRQWPRLAGSWLTSSRPTSSRTSGDFCARCSMSCKNRIATCGGTRTARHSTSTFHQASCTSNMLVTGRWWNLSESNFATGASRQRGISATITHCSTATGAICSPRLSASTPTRYCPSASAAPTRTRRKYFHYHPPPPCTTPLRESERS